MLKTRTILLILILLLAFLLFTSSGIWESTKTVHFKSPKKEYIVSEKLLQKLRQKATEAKSFINANKYNELICLLADMSLPSGQNRFFIYNLKKDTILNAGIVTHGRCNQTWLEGRKYDNTPGCGCTSLGKYKVGYPYYGKFGLAFKLYGMDSSNSNAFKRFVVLHAHECVPEAEVRDEICQSDGCPTVSKGYLQSLSPIIKASEKPVLLWIFDPEAGK